MKFLNYFIILCFIVILVIICIYFSLLHENDNVDYLKDVTRQINVIFETLDKNNDGYLDIEEFSSLKKNYRIFMHKYEEDASFEVICFVLAVKFSVWKGGGGILTQLKSVGEYLKNI